MSKKEVSLSGIEKSLFDPMQITRRNAERWHIGADAMVLESLPEQVQAAFSSAFDPIAMKVERISALPPNPEVVIGGLCSIFTGDLEYGNAKEAVQRLRMDQLVESVGNLRGKTMFVVMEDSFFSRLTGLPATDLKKQAHIAAERITRWQRMTTGEIPDLRVGFTSDPTLERGIFDAVRYIAYDILKNPDFARMQSAPIVMMYTSIWTDLLSSLSYIPSSRVVCVEPAVHFVDSRTFSDPKLQYAYEDFTQWLKDNPYAKPKSANANLGIAGFLESVTGDQTKRRTRLLPFNNVPTTMNVQTWIANLAEKSFTLAFPLRNSPIFAEAVNWGLWNPTIREQIASLICLEDEYYEVRNALKKRQGSPSEKQEQAQGVKTLFTQKATPVTQAMTEEISTILTAVLGD